MSHLVFCISAIISFLFYLLFTIYFGDFYKLIKDSPQFHAKDIAFTLNLLQNAINPALAKQNIALPASTSLATSLIRSSTSAVHGALVNFLYQINNF